MKGKADNRPRRVSVTDPIAAARRYDYADAFELRLEGPDRCSPEEWVRAGVDATPAWIKRIAGHADGLGSARIIESDADVVVLEDSDPLMNTVMVGRNIEPERRVLTTVLRYRRPLLARAVWLFVGILHRRTARRLVAIGLRQAIAPRVEVASRTSATPMRPSRSARESRSSISHASWAQARHDRPSLRSSRPRRSRAAVALPRRRRSLVDVWCTSRQRPRTRARPASRSRATVLRQTAPSRASASRLLAVA
jgi:hypothetical protein